MAKSAKRPLAVFHIKKLGRIGDFFTKVSGIMYDIGNNPLVFVTPVPAIATAQLHLDELVAAEVQVQTRVPGKVALRDEKYNQVLDDMRGLLNYVQNLADNAANTEAAITIITTSGFDLKVNGVRIKAPLEAKNTPISGTVKLIAKAAGNRASYNWQMTTDNQGIITWTDLPTTLKANTTVGSLTRGSLTQFRVRQVTKTGPAGWSNAVSIIVT